MSKEDFLDDTLLPEGFTLKDEDIILTSKVTFDSIVGQKEAIEKLKNFSTIMNNKDFFKTWPIKKPRAYAFTGPSGCGKTEALKAFSNEANCPWIPLTYEQIAGSLYGETVKKLETFKAKVEDLLTRHENLIVFIDEADGIFSSRTSSNTHHVDKQIVTFFLRWLDGMDTFNTGLLFVATSNCWETVDIALRRGGRFTEVKFKPLTPLELVETFKKKSDDVNLRAGREIFPANLNYANGMLDNLTGADVNSVVETLVYQKAIACFQDPTLPDVIGIEDLRLAVSKLAQNKDKSTRSMGFGR